MTVTDTNAEEILEEKKRKPSEDDAEGLICHCSVSQEWPQETSVF